VEARVRGSDCSRYRAAEIGMGDTEMGKKADEMRQYGRLLAAATMDYVTARDTFASPHGNPDDIDAMAYAMVKLDVQANAWILLYRTTSLSYDEAGKRVAAMALGELGVWGVIGQGDRYHICGKDFTDDGGTTLQCTDDFDHKGRECNQ
jgi:hypothetical protein